MPFSSHEWGRVKTCGVAVGVSAIFLSGRMNSVASGSQGLFFELDAIAAVVIGGGSLSGGRGSILGTLTGALIMQVISSGCTSLRLPNPIQEIIIGCIDSFTQIWL